MENWKLSHSRLPRRKGKGHWLKQNKTTTNKQKQEDVIYSNKRHGAYLIFGPSSAALILERHLFKNLTPHRNISFYFNVSFSVCSKTGVHHGEPLSPILGLGFNSLLVDLFIERLTRETQQAHCCQSQSKRSYLSVKGNMILFAGEPVPKNKVTRERVDSRN